LAKEAAIPKSIRKTAVQHSFTSLNRRLGTSDLLHNIQEKLEQALGPHQPYLQPPEEGVDPPVVAHEINTDRISVITKNSFIFSFSL